MKKSSSKFSQSGMSHVVIIVGVVIVGLIVIAFVSGAAKVNLDVGLNESTDSSSTYIEESESSEMPPKSDIVESVKPSIKSYKNETHGVSLEHPSTWSIEEGASSDPVFALLAQRDSAGDNFSENIAVTVTDLSAYPGLSSSAVLDIWISENENSIGFEAIERTSPEIAGNVAEQLVYKVSFGEFDAHGRVSIFVKNDVAYILLYTAKQGEFDKFLGDVDMIFESFEVE